MIHRTTPALHTSKCAQWIQVMRLENFNDVNWAALCSTLAMVKWTKALENDWTCCTFLLHHVPLHGHNIYRVIENDWTCVTFLLHYVPLRRHNICRVIENNWTRVTFLLHYVPLRTQHIQGDRK